MLAGRCPRPHRRQPCDLTIWPEAAGSFARLLPLADRRRRCTACTPRWADKLPRMSSRIDSRNRRRKARVYRRRRLVALLVFIVVIAIIVAAVFALSHRGGSSASPAAATSGK